MKRVNILNRSKKNIIRVLCIVGAVALIAFAAIVIYKSIYYKDRWYKGTSINGLNVSEMTLDESKQKLKNLMKNYNMYIEGRDGGNFEIKGEQIEYTMDPGDQWDKLFEKQHDSFSFFRTDGEKKIEYNVTYKEAVLLSLLSNSSLLKGSDTYEIIKPVSAYVVYNKNKNQYECIKEIDGNQLAVDKFVAYVKEGLAQSRSKLELDNKKLYPDVYEKPQIISTDKILTKALALSNRAVLRFVVWDLGNGVKEKITPEDIAKWISFKKGKIVYDDEKIGEWVEKMCLRYKTVGKSREFISHNGKNIKVNGGDYGWQIDYYATFEQAKKAIKMKLDSEVTENYIQDPNAENKRAITFKEKIKYLGEGFKRDMNNIMEDWDTNNYTEVSLKEQKVYVIRDGKVAFSCRCISGKPVKDRKTKTGCFFVKEHKDEYTLKGADYETHVKNWVRITWSGTGFHPATWQPWSKWTKTLYKTKGSHGCINLEPRDALEIYNRVKYKEAVFIHN